MKVWLLFCFALALRAHEIGTTRVSADLSRAGEYRIELSTGRPELEAKLRGPVTAEALRSRIQVIFDGRQVVPEVEVLPDVIRLHGAMPPEAREFRWSYGWTYAAYSLSVKTAGAGAPVVEWLDGDQLSAPHRLAPMAEGTTRWSTAVQYLVLGFTHILPGGLDHVLFVLGIYLLCRRPRAVLAQVSAFTLAHSITLGLSIYGVVSLPSRVVEPLIALSIVYVGVENLVVTEVRRWRVALVFGFGLLHGLGFAGALREVGLPRSQFGTALLTFNLGVEAGQLAVIGLAFLLVGWRFGHRVWYRPRVAIPASAAIAVAAAYWTWERIGA